MTAKLNPCPFCGGKAKYVSYRTSEDSEACQVSCGSCDARTNEFEDAYAPSEDAIDAWNRRASTPAPTHISVGSEPVAWTTKGNLETLASTPKEARYMWGLPSGSTISVPLYASPQAPAEHVVPAEDKHFVALGKINDIRNSIIGFQTINWSEHIYPLVAALEEAGIEGAGYPASRANVGTMLDRTLAAENEVIRLRAALAAIEYRDLSIEEAKKIASAALSVQEGSPDA